MPNQKDLLVHDQQTIDNLAKLDVDQVILNSYNVELLANYICNDTVSNDKLVNFLVTKDRWQLLKNPGYVSQLFDIIFTIYKERQDVIICLCYLIIDACNENTVNWMHVASIDRLTKLIVIIKYYLHLKDQSNVMLSSLSRSNSILRNKQGSESSLESKKLDHTITHNSSLTVSTKTQDSTNAASETALEKLRLNSLKYAFEAANKLAATMLVYVSYKNSANKLADELFEHSQHLSDRNYLYLLRCMLRVKKTREQLVNSTDVRLKLSNSLLLSNQCVLYEALWCFWLISGCAEFFETNGVIFQHRSILANWVQCAQRDDLNKKLVRLNTFIQINLCRYLWVAEILIDTRINYKYQLLQYEDLKDQEFQNALSELTMEYKKSLHDLTSYENYINELQSASLRPSAIHSEQFWEDNYSYFEKNDFKALDLLTHILQTSDDPTNLYLALFDIGEFAHLYPNAVLVLKELKLYSIITPLITHHNIRVARKAMLTVQRMMNFNQKGSAVKAN